MTVPHCISEDKSDMRGIKAGWYAIENDGKLSFGPFSSRQECVENHPANERDDGVQVARKAALNRFSKASSC